MNKYKFETLQLHVGQETPDSAIPVQFPFTRPLPTYLKTPPMPLPALT